MKIEEYIERLLEKANYYNELRAECYRIAGSRREGNVNGRLYQGYSSAGFKVAQDLAEILGIDITAKLPTWDDFGGYIDKEGCE